MHIDYWDAEGADVLTHTDTDEAIEACLGNMDVGDWPETVVVDGFVIVEPPPHFPHTREDNRRCSRRLRRTLWLR